MGPAGVAQNFATNGKFERISAHIKKECVRKSAQFDQGLRNVIFPLQAIFGEFVVQRLARYA